MQFFNQLIYRFAFKWAGNLASIGEVTCICILSLYIGTFEIK